MTDWTNIDLDSWQIGLSLIDGLTFSEFVLEADCNCPNVTKAALRAQFEDDLQSRIDDAREVFEHNLDNLVRHVANIRKQK
jgi:queuine/archaeosine tRNA-ribosyltransferase